MMKSRFFLSLNEGRGQTKSGVRVSKKMKKYPDKNRTLLHPSRTNRKQMTEAERKIWHLLKNRQLKYKFRRQQQIGNYIVDFICLEKCLIIECDGGQHSEETDKERTTFLESQGYKILRFWNFDILKNIESVWDVVEMNLNSPSPQPSPLVKGEGEN